MLFLWLSDYQIPLGAYLPKVHFNAAFIPSYTAAKLKNKKIGKKFADDILSLFF